MFSTICGRRMKLSKAALALFLGFRSSIAFAPSPSFVLSSRESASLSALFATKLSQTRASFLTDAATAGLSTVLLVSAAATQPALAAKYGSFGTQDYPEVIDPTTAAIDRDVLASGPVQAALRTVRKAREAVGSLQAVLATDPQAKAASRSIGDPAILREAMNTISNASFDEDTQRGTDRLIRAIVQDLAELDSASAQKEGIARSPRRLEIVNGKLSKLAQAMDDFWPLGRSNNETV